MVTQQVFLVVVGGMAYAMFVRTDGVTLPSVSVFGVPLLPWGKS